MVAKENDVIQLFKDVSLMSAFEDDYITSAFESFDGYRSFYGKREGNC